MQIKLLDSLSLMSLKEVYLPVNNVNIHQADPKWFIYMKL